MRTTDRYLTREVLAHAGLGLLLFTFVIYMREAGRLLDVAARGSSWAVAAAFACALPQALVFTLPMAVLVGVLLTLGRLGADNEITAWRAAGVSGRRLAGPLLGFAAGALVASLALGLWIAPASGRELVRLEARLARVQVAAAVRPRVFIESIPKAVVYVADARQGGREWRNIFLADTSDATSPRVTLAKSGALLSAAGGEPELHLADGASYNTTPLRPENLLASSFLTTDIPLPAPPQRAGPPPLPVMTTRAVWLRARFGADWRAARIELHRRLALAFACLALALLGLGLGLRARGGGRAGGFLLTIALVFAYYILFILGIALARLGRLPPGLGVWAANLICLGLGAWLLFAAERIPRAGKWARAGSPLRLRAAAARIAPPPPASAAPASIARIRSRWAWARSWGKMPGAGLWRRLFAARRGAGGRWTPTLLDGYVARRLLGYIGLLLAAFLLLVLTATFFELLGDLLRTRAGLGAMAEYLFFLSPQMLYQLAPVAILVAALVTVGLMSKANEITAMKACGLSVYRLAAPVVAAAALLAALQFTVDQSFLPNFNRRQEALRAEIKGRPPQTFQSPERRWVYGEDNDIFYFQYYDPYHDEFGNLSIFRIDPATFRLTRRVYARSARWDPRLRAWVFEAGWVRDFDGLASARFQRFQIASFPRLRETPAYFKTDARESAQMSYDELAGYIRGLRRAGYDVGRLSVELDSKLAYPAITLIMALLAFPFALSVGRRGAVAGVAAAIGVGIVYWVSAGLAQALGNLDQIPPAAAAWAPDVLFLAAALYLLLRVPT